MSPEIDPEYVSARRVLLDALQALGEHRTAAVLVGAQAIYLRVGEGSLQVAPYITDGDLALNPNILHDEPLLADAMIAAGFKLSVRPGTWARQDVEIDLMVPELLAGAGRRGARLGLHGKDVARKTRGLEATLVDNDILPLEALGPHDSRVIKVAVAGLASLLVAKLHKLAERQGNPLRSEPKDALDILRMLQAAELQDLGMTLTRLGQHPVAGPVTREARALMSQLFGSVTAHGPTMAIRASVGLEDPDTIGGSCTTLATELLAVWSD